LAKKMVESQIVGVGKDSFGTGSASHGLQGGSERARLRKKSHKMKAHLSKGGGAFFCRCTLQAVRGSGRKVGKECARKKTPKCGKKNLPRNIPLWKVPV